MSKRIIHQVNNATGELRTLEVVRLTTKHFCCVKRDAHGTVIDEMSVPRASDFHTCHDTIKAAAEHAVKVLTEGMNNNMRKVDAARLTISAIKEKYLGVNNEANATT